MFKSYSFVKEVNDKNYIYRILEMNDTIFIYIGESGNENLNTLAMAMEMTNKEVLKTTIIDKDTSYTEDLAFKISKKLGRIVYLSCNGIEDTLVIQPTIVNHLFQKILPTLCSS